MGFDTAEGFVDRLHQNIAVLWTAYQASLSAATQSVQAGAAATLLLVLGTWVLLPPWPRRRARIVTAMVAAGAIGLVSTRAMSRYETMRRDGYFAANGRGEDARTVQIVCAVVRGQVENGFAFGITAADAEKLRKACGSVPSAREQVRT